MAKGTVKTHRDARLTVAGRLVVIEWIAVHGWPVAQAAAQAISRATAYGWWRRWQTEGARPSRIYLVRADQPSQYTGIDADRFCQISGLSRVA